MPLGETATAPSGSVGVMASACLEEEIVGTRETLAVAARDRQPDSGDGLAWAAEGGGEARSVCWAAPRSGGLKSLWRSDEGRHIQRRG